MSFVTRAVTIAAAVFSFGALAAQASSALAADVTSPVFPAATAPAAIVPSDQPASPTDTAPAVRAAIVAPDADDDEQVAYPTLAAAVAAQDAGEPSSEDLRCLAGAVYYESRGEPLAGQLAVAEVIMNRASSGRFASDVCGVVTQRGQFSFVRGGHVPTPARRNADWNTAVAVAKVAMKDAWSSVASKALYFHARSVGGFSRVRVATIGNHIFYR